MTETVAAVTTAELIGFALTLFLFFCSQAVALFIWYRKHKADRAAEKRQLVAEQKTEQEKQLDKLQAIIDKDIGAVREEVADVRKDLERQDRTQTQRNEQLHGHLRSLETSRPTRDEMEKNMAQLRELVVSTKVDLEKAVGDGFRQLDRRFDEFKEYAKELWGGPRR